MAAEEDARQARLRIELVTKLTLVHDFNTTQSMKIWRAKGE